MGTRYGWMADTSEAAFQKVIELQRRMMPGDKLRHALEMSDMMMRMSEDNVRKLYPHASDREVFLRAAARRLGRETVIKVYGRDQGLWMGSGERQPAVSAQRALEQVLQALDRLV
jgi:hypothetical protein